jgi:hypothetical protein
VGGRMTVYGGSVAGRPAVWIGNLVCNTRLLVKIFSGRVFLIGISSARVRGGKTVLETVSPSGRARAGG